MDKGVEYENSAFSAKDCDGDQTTTIEMEQMDGVGMTVSGCCASPNVHNDHSSDNKIPKAVKVSDVKPNVCPGKCPAVDTSPWDPIKTRFFVIFGIAIILWLFSGVFIVLF